MSNRSSLPVRAAWIGRGLALSLAWAAVDGAKAADPVPEDEAVVEEMDARDPVGARESPDEVEEAAERMLEETADSPDEARKADEAFREAIEAGPKGEQGTTAAETETGRKLLEKTD